MNNNRVVQELLLYTMVLIALLSRSKFGLGPRKYIRDVCCTSLLKTCMLFQYRQNEDLQLASGVWLHVRAIKHFSSSSQHHSTPFGLLCTGRAGAREGAIISETGQLYTNTEYQVYNKYRTFKRERFGVRCCLQIVDDRVHAPRVRLPTAHTPTSSSTVSEWRKNGGQTNSAKPCVTHESCSVANLAASQTDFFVSCP